MRKSETDNFYLASVKLVEGIGNKTLKKILNHFQSGEKIWTAEEDELKISGLSDLLTNSLINFRNAHSNCPEQLSEFCAEKDIKICSIVDSQYPSNLKNIGDGAPTLFYYKGELQSEVPRIAIVGTRGATAYGLRVAENLAEELANYGVTIVSGAAYGIDTAAHKGALKSGRTVAVLGEGLEVVNSREKKNFLGKIIDGGGVVLSEYSPNMPPSKGTFPQRNRIIAGLSTGTVIVEAGSISGAMITAKIAAEYGRLVFVIPGSIYAEKSRGCHELIRDGATLARDVKDIIEGCKFNFGDGIIKQKVIGLPPLEGKEESVFKIIPIDSSISSEDILMKLDEIEISELSMILIKLESKGYIKEDFLGNYLREYGIN